MSYTIIEDCSPYYIKFKYTGIDKLSKYCAENFDYENLSDLQFGAAPYSTYGNRTYILHRLSIKDSKKILDMLPMYPLVPINPSNCSIFNTKPGGIEIPHKDGFKTRCGINFGIEINNNLCRTNWYDDQLLSEYEETTEGKISRIPYGYIRDKHVPSASTVLQQDEAILFNTDIYHDWDNRQSTVRRIILTLRFLNIGDIYFNDIRKKLFGY